MKTLIFAAILMLLAGCNKYGGSRWNHVIGDWAEVHMPAGCVPKQVAAEEAAGVVVLCEDGRIFH